MKLPPDNNHRARPPRGAVRPVLSAALILAVLAAGVIGMVALQKFGPKAVKEEPPKIVPTVKTITAAVTDRQLYVLTQGEVTARMSTQLASEVVGKVVMVSPKLKTGGTFRSGEVMLEIDKADYAAALARARSSLADARLALEQERARAEQALRDWRKLGKGEPPALVARKPQLASAEARVAAAEAEAGKAARDLERTVVRAPYACRIDRAYTDLGSYLAPGARMADIYAVRVREVRVPVPLADLAYLNSKELVGAHVDVEAELAGEARRWSGRVSRNEGKVDRSTMMVHLVVEIAPSDSQPIADLPPPGLFVNASVRGRVIKNIVEIPRSALRADLSVLAVGTDGRLEILPVQVARTMEKVALVSSGIPAGKRVIVSAIETPVPGMEVAVKPQPKPKD